MTNNASEVLVCITYPPRHAGVIVCLVHLMQMGDAELRQGLRHDEILSETVAFHGHRCLMCGVDAVLDQTCENNRCRLPLHPQWPAVYCCNDCALEDA
jgi:hypothetical protein